ncbi:alpha/beta hydrolase-fold protein [Lewinella sp. IMCC34183]|uniref:alpha/beta hydrolase-fold protein n=1 Tax=Lewinella sp. IMCC34183 TaxID=2248762 RepID=UPI000E227D88|nr:alpha/beta hydrolase-fold protein [Lewinella sp. IMCC34183]
MRTRLLFVLVVALCTCVRAQTAFSVLLPESLADSALDGRLMVMLSTDTSAEPRFQISDGPETQLLFAQNADGWQPGSRVTVDAATAYGYPVASLADLPNGTYQAQALLHRYETFRRADGHTVKLPMDRGEGQQWNLAPGNLLSTPVQVTITDGRAGPIELTLDHAIPEIEQPEDTEYVKHIRIRSELLSEFWGRDMYLGAHVLLPEGWADHPNVAYPLAIMHGHFPSDFGGWRTTPPDTTQPCVYSARFGLDCYNRTVEQEAYDFYRLWTGPDFPRVIAVEIQHANPYYDDSYAVNSENLGPYGDAITYELIPEIERRFRGIGEGWARFVYGGSTGGWEALAVQVKYPDEYGTCYAACPDPIDFRAYTVVNLYEDANAYYLDSRFKHTERPGHRDSLGHVSSSLREMNQRELVLGDRSRSGQQWDIWEAVYSPVGPDGYPRRIWDKVSGQIDPEVAEYWRENYDLTHILQRDWAELGPKLRGKLNIYVGDMDNYYLNNAVYLAEDFLRRVDFGGEITYGDRAEHCWNGDPTQPNAISRLRYHRMFIPKWAGKVSELAPAGADLTSWRY